MSPVDCSVNVREDVLGLNEREREREGEWRPLLWALGSCVLLQIEREVGVGCFRANRFFALATCSGWERERGEQIGVECVGVHVWG